jgi:glycosyltransferase involved in cell wall biosynthesis
MTIHIVYPSDFNKIAAPWVIGNNLVQSLGLISDVKQYDWEDTTKIEPAPGDILIGHPHPMPGRVFTKSLVSQNWVKRVIICPYNGPNGQHFAQINDLSNIVDNILLICGPFWRSRVPPEWQKKVTFLDIAINQADFPRIKTEFNPKGKRKFLFIGCTLPEKGSKLLSEIAKCDELDISHIGYGLIPGCYEYGYLDLSTEKAHQIIAMHDFIIAPGLKDANPTTILEGISWGLPAFCTKESGWGEDIAIHFEHNVDKAIALFTELNNKVHYSFLAAVLEKQTQQLREKYTWKNFTNTIIDVIRSDNNANSIKSNC